MTRKATPAEKQARLVAQQDDGAKAKQILDNPLFTRVITSMIAGNIENWRSADPSDTHLMQRHHALDGFLRDIRGSFEAIAQKGEDARKEMSRIVSGRKTEV